MTGSAPNRVLVPFDFGRERRRGYYLQQLKLYQYYQFRPNFAQQ